MSSSILYFLNKFEFYEDLSHKYLSSKNILTFKLNILSWQLSMPTKTFQTLLLDQNLQNQTQVRLHKLSILNNVQDLASQNPQNLISNKNLNLNSTLTLDFENNFKENTLIWNWRNF